MTGKEELREDPKARWVPTAVSDDISNGTVCPAQLPSGSIAVWRSEAGKIHANGDRCPHRGMRLSHGFVRGETLSCIYHGWRYGPDGSCVHIPAHPNLVPPKSINCGPLPVAEQNGIVWVAAEEPTEAPATFQGYEALRSLVFSASPSTIATVANGQSVDGGFSVQLDGLNAILLVEGRATQDAFVIALVETGLSASGRLSVSQALDALRRSAEAAEVCK